MPVIIGNRIAELRRERGMNQEELAEKANISRITLARYETGVIDPGAKPLSRLADALSVSVDILLCREDKLPPFLEIIPNKVPVVGEIACGSPITAEQNIEGYADLPDGIRADFALRCKGDSMEPTFRNGDLVLIRKQADVADGQIAAIGIDGEAVLKHIYRQKNGILCVSDNPKYAPVMYEQPSVLVIYGLAVGFVRKLS